MILAKEIPRGIEKRKEDTKRDREKEDIEKKRHKSIKEERYKNIEKNGFWYLRYQNPPDQTRQNRP